MSSTQFHGESLEISYLQTNKSCKIDFWWATINQYEISSSKNWQANIPKTSDGDF